MTSLPPFFRMLTPNSIVFGEPTKSIAAAAPPPVASITCLIASGAALSMVATAPIWRACALLRVDIGNDDLAGDRGRRDVYGAAAYAARTDDHQVVVRADTLARLLER